MKSRRELKRNIILDGPSDGMKTDLEFVSLLDLTDWIESMNKPTNN